MTVVLSETLEQGILQLTMNRPERLNALDAELTGALTECFHSLNRDRQVRAVILTGAGRGFCAGADLKSQGEGPGAVPGTDGMSRLGFVYKYQEYLADLMLAIYDCDKPVIAAVNGAAVGGGLAIAMACDVRFAASGAKFGAAFIKTGLSACDVGCSYLLPRLVGVSAASELMLTGRVFDAAEARSLGLTSRTLEPGDLQAAALDSARAMRENSEYGVWMTKKGLHAALDAPSLRHAMELENRTQVLGYFSGCMEESMQAFAEGRPPQWRPL
ncbi:enoyl-CoA hydratase/isomerase family protein [Parahaliea aestuarii]|uniref:Enoyl-CoA hydratase n=1 Tax=Parahaliea aestuarii TaxID=1852021 RepID=A0A5C8ZSQ0_9GAMM|nr:enoyl-CoA hydratase-related protein [Parahaliea aestuarii]TXS91558.1 enoyl-CoA hydratase [Parahaliea aestuarii]